MSRSHGERGLGWRGVGRIRRLARAAGDAAAPELELPSAGWYGLECLPSWVAGAG